MVKILYKAVQKQTQLWLETDWQSEGKKDVCEDLALIHEAFFCLCMHIEKDGLSITNVHYEPEEDEEDKKVQVGQVEEVEAKPKDRY